ncbi:hypothetical protein RF55_10935 [Lasius niger]|uniref:Endonuclease/exonuclease/phosphatase domain-containing protein n=1 Tax=Lasius niger TaxID=67767 RepID=A0A0J7KGR2_LASNI|nr:hypothetical protein RF55_10935 [Lasius niger]
MAENWNILGNKIGKKIEEKEDEQIIVGGDFNFRIGELGGDNGKEGGIERKSKDKTVGNKGKNMIDYIKEKGWYLLNGSTEAIDRVEEFKVGDRVDSDHMPIMVTLEERGRRGKKKEGEVKKEEEKWRICWDKESIRRYKKNTKKTTWEEDLQGMIEEKWEKLKGIVYEAIIKKKMVMRRIELGHKDWWDRQCSRQKREMQRCYKKWRKNKVKREKYLEEKRKLRELAERKQRENREKGEKK